MNTSEYSIDVSEVNFEYEVITFSKNVPVLVDFWAEWCQPCKSLSPILERLVAEAKGSMRLAKVNIDQNPNLARQFNVRSIPTVKAFIEGQVAGEFAGAQPEGRVREFISKLTPPSPLDLDIEKGQGLLLSHQWSEAEKILQGVLNQKPESAVARLGLAKALLAQGKADAALGYLEEIPDSRELHTAELLKPFTLALQRMDRGDLPEDSDLDAVFHNSLRLARQGKFPLALDGLLDILRQDKHYRDELARNVILGILELMGNEDPQTREYRSELASALF
ncbi:MAG: thioredoxin [Anaerolineaceae bacterium]|nr:thioredoxin [Anaerolineaceae bacterium]